MDSQTHQRNPPPSAATSLRGRYLAASVSLVAVVLLAALAASHYVSQVTAQNNLALSQAGDVSAILDQVPSALRQADHALQDLLASPELYQRSRVADYVRLAHTRLSELAATSYLQELDWQPQLLDLQRQLAALETALQGLLSQYAQPGWLYPAIPLIAGTMFEANRGIDTGLGNAVAETKAKLDDPQQLALYERLVTLRGLWRRLILDFRSRMIQFAGLPGGNLPDNGAMDDLYALILRHIDELERNPEGLRYGFETEELVPRLRGLADAWYGDYQQVRQLQASHLWRQDVVYVDETVRPLQRSIDQQLYLLQRAVTAWGAANAAAVRNAASDINHVLWAVAALALVSALINFLFLDHGVLRPVGRVSDALSAEADGEQEVTLPSTSHREISQLVHAFEHMRQQIQERQTALEHQALHDVLTGLPNRALLQDRLAHGLRTIDRTAGPLGLLLLDLDRFKEINDTLGHQAGDRVLQEVARRLRELVRDSDTVARLGGDEFAVVLPGLDREAATELARRIAATLDSPYQVDGQSLYLGASVGVVIAPEDGKDPGTLMRRADSAMYGAKRGNRDYAFYSADRDQITSQGLRLTSRLREALEQDLGMTLHYQPRQDLGTARISGAEALLRWEDDDGNWIPPERIVRTAEHANLIRDLTRWVLHRALQDCAYWHEQGLTLGVSVNLSARNLEDTSLPALVEAGLHRYGLSPRQLTLELTESAVMADPGRARKLLSELAEMGICLSIDDFGTGFSSLAYLSQLRVHELKIDKSFVLGMARNSNDAVIVHSIIDLAHNLGLRVVAEGVERVDILDSLRSQGCDEAQGYLIGRPAPLDALLPLVSMERRAN